MRRGQSTILLAIFLLSVSVIPAVELGHDLLHKFTNPFHTHAVRLTSAGVHSMADHHHFRHMRFTHEMEEAHSADNLVWFAYCFFKEAEHFKITRSVQQPEYIAPLSKLDYVVTLLPPAPPPQFRRS